MLDPVQNIGKICKSLEKYFDVRAGRIKVKSRPVLIIGCEEEFDSPHNIDYELLPISKIQNFEPDSYFDIYLDEQKIQNLGLHNTSYIRSHKTMWNHSRNMRIESPIGDLKDIYPELFEEILIKNHEWVTKRTNKHILKTIEVNVKEYIDDLPF